MDVSEPALTIRMLPAVSVSASPSLCSPTSVTVNLIVFAETDSLMSMFSLVCTGQEPGSLGGTNPVSVRALQSPATLASKDVSAVAAPPPASTNADLIAPPDQYDPISLKVFLRLSLRSSRNARSTRRCIGRRLDAVMMFPLDRARTSSWWTSARACAGFLPVDRLLLCLPERIILQYDPPKQFCRLSS